MRTRSRTAIESAIGDVMPAPMSPAVSAVSTPPIPPGVGIAEPIALVAGLTGAQIPAAIAASAVVLFRVLTYWIRIPIGWFAMRYLERAHVL